MSTCTHGLPLTLRPVLMVFRSPDEGAQLAFPAPGTTLEQTHAMMHAMEADMPGAECRAAFVADVADAEEAERYYADPWSDDAGYHLALFVPPTKDGFCANPDCDLEMHAVGCTDCKGTLAVYVHAAGPESLPS